MTGTSGIATDGAVSGSRGDAPSANAPNFFVLGGAKCGTTSLYHLLKQVEELYLPERKEPRFFAYGAAYERGIAWYLGQYFSGAERFAARGEATPQYLHGRRLVAERIRSCLGEDLRFVVVLRDPVKRSWSHFLHAQRLGIEELPFRKALAAEKRRLAENPERWCGYFSDGLYAAALEDWFAVFARERFLLLLTDELERDPHRVVERVCAFVGVEPPVSLDVDVDANSAAAPKSPVLAGVLNKPNGVTNVLKRLVPFAVRQNARDLLNAWNRDLGTTPAPMAADVEHRLRAEYRDDIEALERLTAFDLAAWRTAEPLARARSGT
jgi:hypothetical protein